MQQDILAFIRAHPVAHLATVAEGAPRVRAMMPFKVDTTGIYIGTLRDKDLYRQLTVTPRIELSFVDMAASRQLRMHGMVSEREDEASRQAMYAVFSFLEPVVKEEGMEALRVFHLERGEYHWWDFSTGVGPQTWLSFSATAAD